MLENSFDYRADVCTMSIVRCDSFLRKSRFFFKEVKIHDRIAITSDDKIVE